MTANKRAVYDDVFQKLGQLRRELDDCVADENFRDIYHEIPPEIHNHRAFHHVVYQDVLHAYYYACRGGNTEDVDAEICRMLLTAQNDKFLTLDETKVQVLDQFLRFEEHEPGDKTPEFLTVFNDDEDLAFIAQPMIELAKRWDELATALVRGAPEAVKTRMNGYLQRTQIALERFHKAEEEYNAPPAKPSDSASTSTAVTVTKPQEPPARFENAEINSLYKKAQTAGLSPDAMKYLEEKLAQLDRIPDTSADYSSRLQPLAMLVDLPWDKRADEQRNFNEVRARMNEKHAGLDKIKERISEHIAVQIRTGKPGRTILCLDGAPGVGKTSMAETIAYAMGRPLVRIALGGMNDTAQMVGHSSTYIGAMPGRIINGLLQAGVKNPVILLDEIDKIDTSRGNLEATMLAILDPAQNNHFQDVYINTAFDLSEVLFIATSNNKWDIMRPLRDRMEIINLPSYSTAEKLNIAQKHLVPKNMESHGLTSAHFSIVPAAIRQIISDYTQESGVRGLERHLQSLMRKAVMKLETGTEQRVHIGENELPTLLNKPRFQRETLTNEDAVGVVNGLYVAGSSGGILPFEAIKIPRKRFAVKGTGLMRETMKETLTIVTSWLESLKKPALLKDIKIEDYELHVDATSDGPKDGPSAGIAVAAACVSALTDKPLRHDLAMTGKMTPGGIVLPVGGIREKLEGAVKNGMNIVLIPKDNEKDLKDVTDEIKDKLTIISVSHIDEALSHVFAREAQKCLTWDDDARHDILTPEPGLADKPAEKPVDKPEDPPAVRPVPLLPAPTAK